MLSESEITIILRTNLAVLLGLAIAWERKASGAPVRGKSIVLATMTCAALTATSIQVYGDEAARVVAGIVTGIGFLGAGMILRSATGEVHGQTSAAGLWTMSLVGITVGSGHEILGILLTIMAYVIMAWDDWPLVNRLKQRLARRKTQEAESLPSSEIDKTNG
jgi:putative Mg2+ transporter-C (MgtC) family protein